MRPFPIGQPLANRKKKAGKTCKVCGQRGLNWQQVKGSRWRLHEGDKVHLCQNAANDFDIVEEWHVNHR